MSQSDYELARGNALDGNAPPNAPSAPQEAYDYACRTDPPLQSSNQLQPIAQEQPQQQSSQQLANQQNDHPRFDQRLGGWLLVIVVLSIISSVQGLFGMFETKGDLNTAAQFSKLEGLASATGLADLCGFLAFAYWISGVIFTIMLLTKNKRFFLAFLITEVLSLVYITVLMHFTSYIIPGFQFFDYPLLVIITLLAVVELIVFSLYFVSSKRVRIYMGSEEYLKVNPFAKRLNRNQKRSVEPTSATATTATLTPSASDN